MRRLYAALLIVLISGAMVYLWRVPTDPPGFYLDESSICYNAHTIAQTGRDEYGNAWPLFFRAFGEYKNPTLIYLLAALFKLTGPSIAVARFCSATLGLLTGIILGLLSWRMTRRFAVAAAVAVATWLTPWLYECSRVVLEVTVYPSLLALFLLVTWRASRIAKWTWRDVIALAVILALLSYSYSIGRLLGPLLALGLVLLVSRGGWRGLFGVWASYGMFLLPMLIFHQRHPGALTDRFRSLTYLTSDKPLSASFVEFIRRYGADINPWRWLVNGGTDVRDHLQGTGSMLAVIVVLGLAGLCLVLRRHRSDPWWRFVLYALVISVVPGALTRNEFSQLRLIAFPVIFLVLTIPSMAWLVPARGSGSDRPIVKLSIFSAAMIMMASQGIYLQWLYHRSAPDWWYVFDARVPGKVLAPALATGRKPIYLFDEPGRSGYIQALWHGVLSGIEPERFVRLPPDTPPPRGAVVISTEEDCRNCRLIARSLNYIVYAVPPYPDLVTERKRALDVFQASIVLARNVPSTIIAGQKFSADLLIRNVSALEWPAIGDADGHYAVKIVARWRNGTSNVSPENEREKSLPYDVEPGDTVGLLLDVTAPAEPGDYSLEFDLTQEGVGGFAAHGWEPLRLPTQIKPDR